MSERPLATMRIENDTISIVETQLQTGDRKAFIEGTCGETIIGETELITEWVARTEDKKMVGLGFMSSSGNETCLTGVLLAPEWRGLGVGRVMTRLMTDLAIRYRQRVIEVLVDQNDAATAALLDEEDFDVVPESVIPGVKRFRKELQWQ